MTKATILGIAATAILLTACSEAKNEYHQTFFHPLSPNGIEMYADEESDTIRIYSLDSWTAKAAASDGQEEWFTITPTSLNIPVNQGADKRMDIKASVNNTGKVRTGTIAVMSHDQIGTFVVQYPWLNISVPQPIYNTAEAPSIAERKAAFVLSAAANGGTSKIEFTVYGDGATLTSDADWAVPDSTTFARGKHTVNVKIGKNSGSELRRATLELKSKSVATPIIVSQPSSTSEGK